MKKILAVAVVILAVASCAALAQGYFEASRDVKMYWQPTSIDEFLPDSPYIYQRPAIDAFAVFQKWMSGEKQPDDTYVGGHMNPDGSLNRPTEITMDDLELLDVYFGDNDLNSFWHQIRLYGPIKDVQTLAKMRTISMTTRGAESAWTCSLSDVLNLLPLFDLAPGTVDKGLPERFDS